MQIDLVSIPLAIADMLSISEDAAGMALTLVLFIALVAPISYLSAKDNYIPETIAGVLIIGLAVYLGWLSFLFVLLIIFLVAYLVGSMLGKKS